MGLNI